MYDILVRIIELGLPLAVGLGAVVKILWLKMRSPLGPTGRVQDLIEFYHSLPEGEGKVAAEQALNKRVLRELEIQDRPSPTLPFLPLGLVAIGASLSLIAQRFAVDGGSSGWFTSVLTLGIVCVLIAAIIVVIDLGFMFVGVFRDLANHKKEPSTLTEGEENSMAPNDGAMRD